MSQNLRNYTKAIYGFDAVVQRVPPDRWGSPSPCDGWNAGEVVAHHCGVADAVAQMARTGEVAFPETPDAGGDPVALWNATRDGVLEALDHAGVIGTVGQFWWGESTIDELLAFAQWDPLAHAVDIGRAVGIEWRADADVARAAISRIEPMAATLRDMGLMGEPVDVAADADPVSRFLGLTGRDPST